MVKNQSAHVFAHEYDRCFDRCYSLRHVAGRQQGDGDPPRHGLGPRHVPRAPQVHPRAILPRAAAGP